MKLPFFSAKRISKKILIYLSAQCSVQLSTAVSMATFHNVVRLSEWQIQFYVRKDDANLEFF